MKEKIAQLETLLTEIDELIDKRLKIEAITIEEYDRLICELEEEYLSVYPDRDEEASNDMRATLIENMIKQKKDSSFFDTDFPKLKSLLTNALAKLSESNSLMEETRFGSRLKGPNLEFKKMLDEKLLDVNTRIFGTFDKILYEGHFTKEGFFNLLINANKTKLFSSLSTAASYIYKKPFAKGWEAWSILDMNGKEQTLEKLRMKH